MGSLGITKEQKRMVIVLLAGAVLVVLNQTLLSPALPSIMQHMSVDETTVQWLTSAYALTEAVVIPLAAWFMGRFSTRRLFLGCMSLFAAGSLVAAIAPVFAVLLVGRVMQAMSTGVMMVMVMSLILLTFPRESRGAAMGLVGLVIAFAPAIGPTAGGLLVDVVGWRALFGVVVAVSVVVIVLAQRTLINHEGFPRTSMDPLSVILSTLGLVPLLYGLSSFASSDNVALCAGMMVVGLVLVGLFAWRQFKLDEPMLRLEVLKSRRYRTGFIVVGILQAVLIGLSVLMPLYVQNVLGFSATISGLATLPGAVLGAAMGLFAGRVFDKSGVRGIAIAGAIVLTAGSVGMFFLGAGSSIIFFIVAYVAVSMGLQMLTTPVNTWGVNSLDNELVQHATAVSNTMNQVGGSLGTALIMSFSAIGLSMAAPGASPVEQLATSYHLSFTAVLALSLIVLVLVALCVRNRKDDKDPVRGSSTTVDPAGVRHTVAEVMDAHPLTIPASAHMGEAARALAASGASGAIVVGSDGSVEGFLSNGDVLRYFGDEMQAVTGSTGFLVLRQLDDENVYERVKHLNDINVGQMATKQIVSVGPDVSFEEACHVLADKRLKELPVVEDGKLIGALHRSTSCARSPRCSRTPSGRGGRIVFSQRQARFVGLQPRLPRIMRKARLLFRKPIVV